MRSIIRAQWVIDSETSEEVLIDLDKNAIIARRVNGRIVDPREAIYEERLGPSN